MAEKRVWVADAPSNIALIKYMGKTEVSGNRPANTSLSYTLSGLKSFVRLELDETLTADIWEPLESLEGRPFEPFRLSEKGSHRFLAHLGALKNHFGFQGFFRVRSANDFPSDCGLASSASSFAALTKAAMSALSELMGSTEPPSPLEMAKWSQKGSGSSCRSFFSPWSVWTPETVSDVPELGEFGELLHQVVVVDSDVKSVSSSEAHKRVTTSLLFEGRPRRAEDRLTAFVQSLQGNNWDEAFQIAWSEFWDMHALFETSSPAFGYMTSGSLDVLGAVRSLWKDHGVGPLVTMDAGPNVHLLYRPDSVGHQLADEISKRFQGSYRVISSSGPLAKG